VSGLDLFTRVSGWVLLLALMAIVQVARRRHRALAHYLLGWSLAVLTWLHFYYPMTGGLIGRTPAAGLWIATLAWLLLLVQLAVGNAMLLKAGRTGPGTVKFHYRTMLAIVALTLLHVLLNGISLHSFFRAS
jgi:hypothetical protein